MGRSVDFDKEELLASINRRLLLVQQLCHGYSRAVPQPLAVPEAQHTWAAIEELIASVRTDLASLSPPLQSGPGSPSPIPARLRGKPFGGTLPGLPRTPDDER